jgi:hypothetical protein
MMADRFDLLSTKIFRYLNDKRGKLREVESGAFCIPSASQSVGVLLGLYISMLLSRI